MVRGSNAEEAASRLNQLQPKFPLGFIPEWQMTVRQGIENPRLLIVESKCHYLNLSVPSILTGEEASQHANWIRAELLLLSNLPELQDAQLLYLSDEHDEDLSHAIRLDSELWAMLTDVAVDRGRRTRRP